MAVADTAPPGIFPWRVAYGIHALGDGSSGAPNWYFPNPINFTASFDIQDPHEVAFEVDGLHPNCQQIQELTDDVWVFRSGYNPPMMRGPLIQAIDSISENEHRVRITGHSDKERLSHWYVPPGNFPAGTSLTKVPLTGGIDAASQGWNLVNEFVDTAAPGGTSEIRYWHQDINGVATTSKGTAVQPGQDLKTAIDSLAELNPGFDWDIVPQSTISSTYSTWAPYRGRVTSQVFKLGGPVQRIERTFDPSSYAVNVFVSGTDANGKPVYAFASNSSLGGNKGWGNPGLWMHVEDGSNLNGEAMQDLADNILAQTQLIKPTYQLILRPGWWRGPLHLWLGDSAQLVYNSGRLKVDQSERITHIDISVDQGVEQVTLSTGTPPKRLVNKFLKRLKARLINLEWRT